MPRAPKNLSKEQLGLWKEKVREQKKRYREKHREKINAYMREYYKKNPEKFSNKGREKKIPKNKGNTKLQSKRYRDRYPEKIYAYRLSNKDKIKKGAAASNKKGTDALHDWYVVVTLGMRKSDCPPQLIEAKRQQLQMYRITKQLISTLKGSANAK